MRLLAALLILFPAISFGAEENQRWVLGHGMASCGRFIAATEGEKLGTYRTQKLNGVTYVSEGGLMMGYALGVLTGINVTRDLNHQIQTDSEAIELWLRNWCSKHPTSALFTAVTSLAEDSPGPAQIKAADAVAVPTYSLGKATRYRYGDNTAPHRVGSLATVS